MREKQEEEKKKNNSHDSKCRLSSLCVASVCIVRWLLVARLKRNQLEAIEQDRVEGSKIYLFFLFRVFSLFSSFFFEISYGKRRERECADIRSDPTFVRSFVRSVCSC